MKLTDADKALVLKWINNKIGEKAVRSQRLNKTTNRCEASHLTVTKSVPKSRCFRRNFDGRANSACHSMSTGQKLSMLIANERLGATNTTSGRAKLIKMADKELYHKNRKRSIQYKKSAKRLRVIKYRAYSKPSTGYSTGCQDPIVEADHTYKMP